VADYVVVLLTTLKKFLKINLWILKRFKSQLEMMLKKSSCLRTLLKVKTQKVRKKLVMTQLLQKNQILRLMMERQVMRSLLKSSLLKKNLLKGRLVKIRIKKMLEKEVQKEEMKPTLINPTPMKPTQMKPIQMKLVMVKRLKAMVPKEKIKMEKTEKEKIKMEKTEKQKISKVKKKKKCLKNPKFQSISSTHTLPYLIQPSLNLSESLPISQLLVKKRTVFLSKTWESELNHLDIRLIMKLANLLSLPLAKNTKKQMTNKPLASFLLITLSQRMVNLLQVLKLC